MKVNFISDVASVFLCLLFLYTGFDKLWHFAGFRLQLRESPWSLLSTYAEAVAWALPLAEISIVLLLLWPPLKKAGFICSAILFGAFILYLSVLLGSGTRLPCSCGGIISSLSWQGHLYFDSACLLLSLAGIYTEHKKRTRELKEPGRPREGPFKNFNPRIKGRALPDP